MDGFIPSGPPGRILVLVRGALGDTLIALTLLSALPRYFQGDGPPPGLTLAGRPATLELLKPFPFVADVLDHDQACWAGLYSRPPLADSRLMGILARHRAAVVLASRDPDPAAQGLKALGLDPVIVAPSRPPVDRPVHLVDHQFRATGITPPETEPVIDPPEAWIRAGQGVLDGLGLGSGGFVILHPGSGGPAKNQPMDRWAVLAERISSDLGLIPLFLIGPAEAEAARWLACHRPAARMVSGLPLTTLAGLLGFGRGLVSHDSGVVHLAARLGRPALAVFGPTFPQHWAPRGPMAGFVSTRDGWDPEGPWSWPDPDRVMAALARMLENKRGEPTGD